MGYLEPIKHRENTMKLYLVIWQKVIVPGLAAVLAAASPQIHAQSPTSEDWNYAASLYLWGAGIQGKLANGSEVDAGFSDILEQLDFAIMGSFEARRDRWALLGDAIYLDLSAEDGVMIPPGAEPGGGIDLGAELGIDGKVFQLYGGYGIIYDRKANLDLIFGARYLDLALAVTASTASPGGAPLGSKTVSNGQDTLDGVLGIRGNSKLNESWYLSYLFDVGTGDSDVTWQALVGAGYSFGWGDILIAYRHLDWQFEPGAVIEEISFSGPALQARWYF